MKAKTPKQVLQAAEWILTNVGWSQGCLCKDENGSMIMVESTDHAGGFRPEAGEPPIAGACLGGALGLVETDPDIRTQAFGILADVIQHHTGSRYIIFFNDNPNRTKQEVLKVIREAIKEAP